MRQVSSCRGPWGRKRLTGGLSDSDSALNNALNWQLATDTGPANQQQEQAYMYHGSH
jgi:hypothetical protein